MARYYVEFEVIVNPAELRKEHEWEVEAENEKEAERLVEYEFPDNEILFVRISKIGDCG